MIEKKDEDLLKDSIDYEDYTENVYTMTIEELKKEGLLKCGGCCSKGEKKCSSGKCGNCRSHCKK